MTHALQELGLGVVGGLGGLSCLGQLLRVGTLALDREGKVLALVLAVLRDGHDKQGHVQDKGDHARGDGGREEIAKGLENIDIVVAGMFHGTHVDAKRTIDDTQGAGLVLGRLNGLDNLSGLRRQAVILLARDLGVVGSGDLAFALKNNGAVLFGHVAVQKRLLRQAVLIGIGRARVVVGNGNSRLVGAACGSQIYERAVFELNARGIDLLGVLGNVDHDIFRDVLGQGVCGDLGISGVLGLDGARLIQDRDAGHAQLGGIGGQHAGRKVRAVVFKIAGQLAGVF